jgi:hypothetical protein
MKKQLHPVTIIVAILVFFAASCNKDDNTGPGNNNTQDCQTHHYGSLLVTNYLSDPYEVYIDNSYKGLVDANNFATFHNTSSGTHATKYIQHSGFVLYPTQYTATANISDCNTATITIQ